MFGQAWERGRDFLLRIGLPLREGPMRFQKILEISRRSPLPGGGGDLQRLWNSESFYNFRNRLQLGGGAQTQRST